MLTKRERRRRLACSRRPLTEEKVKEIRKSLKAGVRGKLLAATYGVSCATISQIKRERTWKPETMDEQS